MGYDLINTLAELQDYIGEADAVAFDFETAPDIQYRMDKKAALDPNKAHIVGISFSIGEGCAIYVPIDHKAGKNITDLVALWEYLRKLFTDRRIVKIAHNLAFEAAFLYKLGIIIQGPVYDTIAAAQLTLKKDTEFRTLSDSGLKTLVPELFNVNLPTFEDVISGASCSHFDELDPADAKTFQYACADSDFTLRLYHLFNAWFNSELPKHRVIAEQVESPTSVFCGLMRYNGILVDSGLMAKKADECEAKLAELKSEITFIIGDVAIGTNAATAAFKTYLYKELNLPMFKKTDKYQESVDDETIKLLEEWCGFNRPELVPLFKLVQEYRKIAKLKSTYISGYDRHINPVTGRIHADFFPLGTETGRFACRNPNLQNMPRAGADNVGIRNFFTAPEGCILLSLDFSQIELRVGAFYCRDCIMLETYLKNGDIHNSTADVVFGAGKHNKEQRTVAKNVNFGTFYGLFPRGLQRTLKLKAGLDVTLEQCESIINNLKLGYPKLSEWQYETIFQARVNRYTESFLGRRRYLPDIVASEWKKSSFAERCALNTPIQGTAADILKLAIGRIISGLPERPWLKPLLQIHDELVFELPEDKVDEAVIFIKECMEAQPFPECDVPFIAEANVGFRFGEMQEWGKND